jgi:peptidoglycan-associated lipoprotein
MKLLKLALFFGVATSLLLTSGCAKWRGIKSGSYVGTDAPLSDFPLDTFYEPTGVDALVFKDVHFDYNQSKINNPEDQATLVSVADWMKNNPEKHVLAEGHCDERGSNDYNLALGEQRALGVRQFLTEQGIQDSKVQTISYGEERPVTSGTDESAWKQNRRAHFLISNGEGVGTGS